MPEIPEVNLPEPALPKEGNITPEMGEATAVSTVDELESTDKESTSIPVSKKRGVMELDPWFESIISSRVKLDQASPLNYFRVTSEAAISGEPFPTRRQESWRFTDLRSIYASRYVNSQSSNDSVQEINLEQYVPIEKDNVDSILVFVNGIYNKSLSYISEDGMSSRFVGPINEYEGDLNDLLFYWNRGELSNNESLGGGYFPIVGNAIAADAAIIDIAPEAKIEKPIVVCHLSTNGASSTEAIASAPRLAFFGSPNSSCTVYECFISIPYTGTSQSPSAMVEETLNRGNLGTCSTILSGATVNLGKGAQIKHFYLNMTNDKSSIVGNIHSTVEDDAQYDLRAISMGGIVGRLSVGIEL